LRGNSWNHSASFSNSVCARILLMLILYATRGKPINAAIYK
jgi:hypothetical protein